METPRAAVEHRTVRHLRPRSVAKVAFALSLTVSAIVLVGLVALYLLGSASGALDSVEGFFESLGWADFQIRFFALVPLFVILAAFGSALVAAFATAGAVLYNLLAEVVGGVEVTTRDR